MVGVGLLVATPSYSWYAVSLLVLVAMTARIEWLPLVIAPTIANLAAGDFGNGALIRTSCYAIALGRAVLGIGAAEPGSAAISASPQITSSAANHHWFSKVCLLARLNPLSTAPQPSRNPPGVRGNRVIARASMQQAPARSRPG